MQKAGENITENQLIYKIVKNIYENKMSLVENLPEEMWGAELGDTIGLDEKMRWVPTKKTGYCMLYMLVGLGVLKKGVCGPSHSIHDRKETTGDPTYEIDTGRLKEAEKIIAAGDSGNYDAIEDVLRKMCLEKESGHPCESSLIWY